MNARQLVEDETKRALRSMQQQRAADEVQDGDYDGHEYRINTVSEHEYEVIRQADDGWVDTFPSYAEAMRYIRQIES